MENRKVMVKSMVASRVGINLPDLKLKRTWEKRGVVRPIPFEELEQALYEPGVEYMFKQGILAIDSMEDKIALGLEEEGTTAPTNIIVLTEAEMDRYWKVLPFIEFKQKLTGLPKEQIQNLVDHAIDKEYTDINKCEYIKEKMEIDIIRAIQLNRQAKEE